MGDSTWDDRAPNRSNPLPPQPPADPPPISTPLPDPPPLSAESRGVRLIQISDARDGVLLNRGYSYWSQACVVGRNVFVFCGAQDGVPRLFDVGLKGSGYQDSISRVPWNLPFRGTTEGYHWSAIGRIHHIEGSRLLSSNPFVPEEIVLGDISQSHPGCDLWQAHSADFGGAYSATVRDAAHPLPGGAYPKIGTVVFTAGGQHYFDAVGELDESQITRDGRRLVIKEKIEGLLTNRIVDLTLSPPVSRRLTNAEGAVGHSDCTGDHLIGEWSPQHGEANGQCVDWDLGSMTKRHLFDTWNMGHISTRRGRYLLSTPTALALVPPAGGEPQYLLDHGMTFDPNNYDSQVFANLDPTGTVATYWANGILYLVVLP